MSETDDLPNVEGLAEFVAQDPEFQDKGAEEKEVEPEKMVEAVPVEKDKPERNELGQFKSKEELLKGYKEIQGFSTKVSQENKLLKEQIAQFQEYLEMQKLQTVKPVQQPEKKFDEQFIEDPEKAVEYAVEKKLQTARVADVLENEESKNPSEFQERYGYAMRLRQYYPQLAASPQGVRKLFELGDRYRQEEMKKNAERSIRLLLGEDADIEKFKVLIAKDKQPENKGKSNLAYMPDTSSGIRPDVGKTSNAHDAQINEAMQKGDIDSVISGLFKKQMAAG